MKRGERTGFMLYGFIGGAALISSYLLLLVGENPFRPFFGPVPPLLVMAGAFLFGIASLALIQQQSGIVILTRASTPGKNANHGAVRASTGALLFFLPVLLADLLFRYPEDINTPLPQALLFYPAIAFVAETLFHLIPGATMLIISRAIRKRAWEGDAPLLIFLPAILTEPIFQFVFAGDFFRATTIFTLFHVLAISCFQIHLLRRFSFMTMLLFRLLYYLLWHIFWGSIRLVVLF